MVVDQLTTKHTNTFKTMAPTDQVFNFIDKYIEDNKKASREPGSMSVYRSVKNHLQNFQLQKKKRITFDEIDYSFFLEFQNFLIGTKARGTKEGLGNVTIAKHLSTLKTLLNYARMHGIEVHNKYKDFKIRKAQLLRALSASLKIMASAVLFDRQPFARTVRWRIVANVLSIGFVVRKCFQCSAGKS